MVGLLMYGEIGAVHFRFVCDEYYTGPHVQEDHVHNDEEPEGGVALEEDAEADGQFV